MFWFNALNNIYWKSWIIALFITTAIFLILWEFISNSNWEPGWRQSLLHLKLVAEKWKRFNKKQILKRIIIKFWLLFTPFILWIIITLLFRIFWASESMISLAMSTSILTWYLFYFAANIYCFWTSNTNQFIHDKITGIAIVDESIDDEEI
jgi:hypothetical protein